MSGLVFAYMLWMASSMIANCTPPDSYVSSGSGVNQGMANVSDGVNATSAESSVGNNNVMSASGAQVMAGKKIPWLVKVLEPNGSKVVNASVQSPLYMQGISSGVQLLACTYFIPEKGYDKSMSISSLPIPLFLIALALRKAQADILFAPIFFVVSWTVGLVASLVCRILVRLMDRYCCSSGSDMGDGLAMMVVMMVCVPCCPLVLCLFSVVLFRLLLPKVMPLLLEIYLKESLQWITSPALPGVCQSLLVVSGVSKTFANRNKPAVGRVVILKQPFNQNYKEGIITGGFATKDHGEWSDFWEVRIDNETITVEAERFHGQFTVKPFFDAKRWFVVLPWVVINVAYLPPIAWNILTFVAPGMVIFFPVTIAFFLFCFIWYLAWYRITMSLMPEQRIASATSFDIATLDIKGMMVVTLPAVSFFSEATSRFYQGETYFDALYNTWAERSMHNYIAYLQSLAQPYWTVLYQWF